MYDRIEERTEELAALMAEIWPDEAEAKPRRQPTAPVDLDMGDLMKKMFASKNGQKIKALYDGDISGFYSQSEADLALMNDAAFWFDCNPHAMDAFMRESALYREKWERNDYSSDTIQRAIDGCKKTYQDSVRERRRGKPVPVSPQVEASPQSDGEVERPVIVWKETDSDQCLLQTEEVVKAESLRPGGVGLYQRGGRPVRVGVAIESPTIFKGIVRDGKTPSIFSVGKPYLENYLTRRINYKKFDQRKQELVDCGCPGKLADRYLDRAGEYGLYPLKAIINHPILRPDGSILDQPGYDRKTGLYYDPCGVEFPPVPENPEKVRSIGAAATVVDVLSECAFKEEVDRSVAFAMLLTAIIRSILPTAPMFIYTAPVRGTGKTEIPIGSSLLSNGAFPDIVSFSPDESEMQKRIFALLREGASEICIDNVEQTLKGETLCSVLSGPTFSGRILGESTTMRVPTCATWSATGNNLPVEGDLTRRTLLCRLDSRLERPEERHFKRNLRAYILEHRPRLIVAALTFLRGYFLAADKPQLTPYGSFQEWSDLIRGAIVWAGMPDPLDSRQDIDANDPHRLALGNVLRAWHGAFGESAQFARDVIDKDVATPELLEALEVAVYSPRGLNTKAVGHWIKKHEGTIINGLRFVRVGDYQKIQLWAVKGEIN